MGTAASGAKPTGPGVVKALKAHVAIRVANLQASIHFYRALFGIEPSKVRDDYAKFDVMNPPLNFTLNQGRASEHGLSHLGIQVSSTEDVLAVRERWIERGLVARDEMNTECCYARQDKSWVRDPDGNEWEVFVVLPEKEPQEQLIGDVAQKKVTQNDASCCAPSCCAPAA